MNSAYLQTVRGQVAVEEFGLILPHEHLFTDLRGPSVPGYAQAEPKDVVQAVTPYLDAAYRVGVTSLVECSTGGVGRNVHVLKELSEGTRIHVVAPTGVYRDEYVPAWMRTFSAEEMAQMWIQDLTSGMDGTDIKAGFIKIAISDDGPRPIEERILKAAAMASKETSAVVASHTPNGEIFQEQWRILEKNDLPPNKFIWVHANLEEDKQHHLGAAKIGVYVEFDGVGAEWQSQEAMLEYTQCLIEAGYQKNILLSHDAGWYQPGNPNGEPEGGYRGYTDLVEYFIPALRMKGISEAEIHQITHLNPIYAYKFDREE
jgi:phosphotriesterase-related protein